MPEMELYIRYMLEYAMIIPGTIGFLLPAWRYFRYTKRTVIAIEVILNAVIILLGAAVSCHTGINTNKVLMPVLPLLLPVGFVFTELRRTQVLFLYFNTIMLGTWSTVATLYAFAPIEVTDPDAPFKMVSGVSCLIIAAIVLFIFRNMLVKRIPAMFQKPELDFLWNYAWLFPLGVSLFFFWVIPMNLENILVGRIYMISCVIWGVSLILVYCFYLFLWYFSEKLTTEQHLIEEKRILNAEKIRFSQIEEHMQELRSLRHDLRQHMRVLSSMASADQFDEMKKYLQKYVDSVKPDRPAYCANYAVDALAAYYQEDAEKKGVRIIWNLSLPPRLGIDETELCVIIGNLLENAIRASEKVEQPGRLIEASIRMAGDNMIGIEIRNHYKDKILLNKEGMPSPKDREGIGLLSVSNTVRKNNGSFSVEIDEEWFCVDIIINIYDKKTEEYRYNTAGI